MSRQRGMGQMTLVVESLSKSYGVKKAIENVSFSVGTGQVYGLLGLNGAGKSTTIRIILDILTPDTGHVLWNDQPAKEQLRSHFGYLPEERGLYPNMKVLEHLVMFARLQGLTKRDALDCATRWLERFEIPHYANSTVSDLSKGNQQKVQFIAAVVHQPQMIILDEPFSGLDPVNTSLFKSVFQELVDNGATILFSSHQLDHVEELSDAIGIIHQSQLVLSGNIADILSAQPPRMLRIRANENDVRAQLGAAARASLRVDARRGHLSIPANEVDPQALLKALIASGTYVEQFELVRPTLNDIFLEKVGRSA